MCVRPAGHRQADPYGLRLSTSDAAADAYNTGVGHLLRLHEGALPAVAESLVHDPTFALGHAAVALLGHEYCADLDIAARLRAARRHAVKASERERSHVHAVAAHIEGDSSFLIRHLVDYPRDALLLSVAVPTIAFAGTTVVPQESWEIVERAAPAYGDDWWYTGLLAFVRQEQCQWDEAMRLACRSLDEEPGAGQSAHARTHVHYETGDHEAGRDWLDSWMHGAGGSVDNPSHYSWHAALHELSIGDLEAVRTRFRTELAPPRVVGCRALVDSCSLLWRWAITPGADDVPGAEAVLAVLDAEALQAPPTPFMALHSAITLCCVGDGAGLERLETWSSAQPDPTYAEVVAPLAAALRALASGDPSAAADQLNRLVGSLWRLGGSDAQREVVEDTLIAALLAAARFDEARVVIDRRLDRRVCRRDLAYLDAATHEANGPASIRPARSSRPGP